LKMAKRSPVEVFSEWAEIGKDEGMAKGHLSAVTQMLERALPTDESFSFLDAGCGNGWVVRLVSEIERCTHASGVDGSERMIEKARATDPGGSYFCSGLLEWVPSSTFDVVHSMEVFYYFEKPLDLLSHIHDSWLAPGGLLVMGADFYIENMVSHDWPEKTQINTMTLLSEGGWIALFDKAGFTKIESRRIDPKEGWTGTLCVTGRKTAGL
jgi:SAM-dependent methyltransferase